MVDKFIHNLLTVLAHLHIIRHHVRITAIKVEGKSEYNFALDATFGTKDCPWFGATSGERDVLEFSSCFGRTTIKILGVWYPLYK